MKKFTIVLAITIIIGMANIGLMFEIEEVIHHNEQIGQLLTFFCLTVSLVAIVLLCSAAFAVRRQIQLPYMIVAVVAFLLNSIAFIVHGIIYIVYFVGK